MTSPIRTFYVFSFLLICCCSFSCFAQKNQSLNVLEDSLKYIASSIKKSENDSVRSSLNERYLSLLKKAVAKPGSFSYPFKSLTTIAKLTSPDGKFRLYNWNLPQKNGTNSYFCLIHYKTKKENRVFELNDVSDTLREGEFSRLFSSQWYGALYYKILMHEMEGQVYYTLLGWDGINSRMFQKLIEILTFDEQGNPVFGAPVFKNYKTDHNMRVIFRYSSSSTMILRFDKQPAVSSSQSRKTGAAASPKSNNMDTWMIVFDRLGNLSDSNEDGQPSYPVPLGETLDGFVFGKGGWNFMENIPVRND